MDQKEYLIKPLGKIYQKKPREKSFFITGLPFSIHF
jgi:hypothetical protein